MLDVGNVVGRIVEAYGQATPLQLRDLFVLLQRDAADVYNGLGTFEGEVYFNPASWAVLATPLRTELEQVAGVERYLDQSSDETSALWAANEQAIRGEIPLEQWRAQVLLPLVFGQMPDGRDTVPLAARPYIAANQLQQLNDAWNQLSLRGELLEQGRSVLSAADRALAGFRGIPGLAVGLLVFGAAWFLLRGRRR